MGTEWVDPARMREVLAEIEAMAERSRAVAAMVEARSRGQAVAIERVRATMLLPADDGLFKEVGRE